MNEIIINGITYIKKEEAQPKAEEKVVGIAIKTGANLTDADLTRADLTRASRTGANLTDADLTRADLTTC